MYSPAKTHRRTANYTCLPGCLECHSKWQRRSRIFGQCNRKQTLKSSGDVAVLMALAAFIVHVTGKTIQVVSENISTIAYLNHMGGPSHELNQIPNAVGTEAINNHVSITCCHVASDRLSRLNDRYEWQFHPELFNLLDTMRGPHTIDRIVFFKTAQTEVFIIRYYHPRSSGVNALVQQGWTLHNNFVNTPFRLMPEIQLQLNVQKADRTIIAPKCAKMKLW